jgi:hypothetical protein
MNGQLKPLAPIAPPLGDRADYVAAMMRAGMAQENANYAYDHLVRCEWFSNDEYRVMMDRAPPHGFAAAQVWQLAISRIDKAVIHDWRDLQAIKSMLVGPEFEAIELYPAESRVMDNSNAYHLFVFLDPQGNPTRVPIGRSERKTVQSSEAQRPRST